MSGKIHKTAFLIASVVFLFFFNGHLGAATAGVIKGETIEEAIRAYVAKNMSWSGGRDVRLEFPGGISDVTLDGEKIACRVESKRNEDFIGNTSFTVRFYENGELLGKQTVRARLELLMDVVVSSRPLHRNTEIGRDDVRLVKRWFTRPPLNIISSPDDVVGKKLRASIKPNTEITGNMVRTIPVVQKGKPVRIVIENGSMGMTTIGMSEQDGMCGELIKVRNVSSQKMIYARVMGNSLVKVEF